MFEKAKIDLQKVRFLPKNGLLIHFFAQNRSMNVFYRQFIINKSILIM